MPVSTFAVVTALGFGALVGWGLGWRAEDRKVALATEAITAVTGAIIWATGPVEDSAGATAAVSLAIGGLAALCLTAITGRR